MRADEPDGFVQLTCGEHPRWAKVTTDLLDNGKRWSEARGEIAQYCVAAGMEEGAVAQRS